MFPEHDITLTTHLSAEWALLISAPHSAARPFDLPLLPVLKKWQDFPGWENSVLEYSEEDSQMYLLYPGLLLQS